MPVRKEMHASQITGRASCSRADVRRRQILDAAAHCFRRRGFHASSMAQIATVGKLSVGQIYRYFDGKDAIIAAIVRQDVEEVVALCAALPRDPLSRRSALTRRAVEGVSRACSIDAAALMIEIRAEAAHNPAISAVVRGADAAITEELSAMIGAAVSRPLSAAELGARVEMFRLIFEGISLRTVIGAAVDRVALTQLVEMTITTIVS